MDNTVIQRVIGIYDASSTENSDFELLYTDGKDQGSED